jgi:plasmid stabilization system protein ParE
VPRYQVELLEEAEADARGLYVWIYEQSPANAEKFAEAMDEAILDLGESAHIWDAKRELRRYYINRYRVTLLYRLRGDLVKVGVVMHQRQKPGYGLDRDF